MTITDDVLIAQEREKLVRRIMRTRAHAHMRCCDCAKIISANKLYCMECLQIRVIAASIRNQEELDELAAKIPEEDRGKILLRLTPHIPFKKQQKEEVTA